MELQVGTKVFIPNSAGKFLILKRAKPYTGETFCRWDIPGGRIKPGETQLEALRREVTEETGLQLLTTKEILAVQDILHDNDKHTVRITYLGVCEATAAVVLNPEEHTDYQWATVEEIKNCQHDTYLDVVLEKLD